jgi:hypothetical protein
VLRHECSGPEARNANRPTHGAGRADVPARRLWSRPTLPPGCRLDSRGGSSRSRPKPAIPSRSSLTTAPASRCGRRGRESCRRSVRRVVRAEDSPDELQALQVTPKPRSISAAIGVIDKRTQPMRLGVTSHERRVVGASMSRLRAHRVRHSCSNSAGLSMSDSRMPLIVLSAATRASLRSAIVFSLVQPLLATAWLGP